MDNIYHDICLVGLVWIASFLFYSLEPIISTSNLGMFPNSLGKVLTTRKYSMVAKARWSNMDVWTKAVGGRYIIHGFRISGLFNRIVHGSAVRKIPLDNRCNEISSHGTARRTAKKYIAQWFA
jgi:hypothetical protein